MQITVIAHPNSKKPRIEEDLMRVINIYVSEPAVGGRANKAITEVLAKYFKTKKSKVILLYGEKNKNKVFEIEK